MSSFTKIPPTPEAPLTLKTVVMTIAGFAFLALSLPAVAVVVGSAVAWFYIDPVTPAVVKFLGKQLEPLWAPMFRHKEDAFMMNIVLLQGVFVPALFFFTLYKAYTTGQVNYAFAFAYHLVRIGQQRAPLIPLN